MLGGGSTNSYRRDSLCRTFDLVVLDFRLGTLPDLRECLSLEEFLVVNESVDVEESLDV